ncbi:PilZ domain-containing protein [Salinarimonas soli]|uniref:PilZ domain-containing protein n=1 Tax=Salinarimonas soli TaxID=1638099 RepID=A0A5B2V856_9HYPH|nr:PilZ domain-containing protein [Salinarimonas soli]KAA2235224.1 PilZ domain-containing protein [Salinarimonas soli]
MPDGVYHPYRYERRRDERIHVRLQGRITSPDGTDLPCATLTVSAGGLAVETPTLIPLGEHVVCHFEQIGQIDAVIVGHHEEGFAVAFVADRDTRGELVRKVDWIERRMEGEVGDVRRHPRHVPPPNVLTIRLGGGRSEQARLLDVSISGAAVEAEQLPPVGSTVWIGPMRGRVVRHLPNGYAVAFASAALPAPL